VFVLKQNNVRDVVTLMLCAPDILQNTKRMIVFLT